MEAGRAWPKETDRECRSGIGEWRLEGRGPKRLKRKGSEWRSEIGEWRLQGRGPKGLKGSECRSGIGEWRLQGCAPRHKPQTGDLEKIAESGREREEV